MAYLIRKITLSKWKTAIKNKDAAISADAITSCLRTSQNTLSVWYAENDIDVEFAKIALLGTLDKVDAIDIVLLDLDSLIGKSLVIKSTAGKTRAKKFSDLHRDISDLTVNEIVTVANAVRETIMNGGLQKLVVADIRKIMKDAVANDLFDRKDLIADLIAHV